MDFTITFLKYFGLGLTYISPVILTLVGIILLLGFFVGRLENWKRHDAFYYAFITATTVGYGDFPPRNRVSKLLAIVIAFTGLILTGIIVAVALNALTIAFKERVENGDLKIKELVVSDSKAVTNDVRQ